MNKTTTRLVMVRDICEASETEGSSVAGPAMNWQNSGIRPLRRLPVVQDPSCRHRK